MSLDHFDSLPRAAVELYLRAVEAGDLPEKAPEDADADSPDAHRELLLGLGLLKAGMKRPELVPVDPETAAAQLERRAAAELVRTATLRDQWQPLTTAYRAARAWSDEKSLVQYVRGKEAIGQQLQLLLSGKVHRVRTIQPGGPRPAELIKGAVAEELALRGRGITRQILYQDSQRNHAPTAHFVRAVTEAGVAVRTLPYLPDRTFLIDDVAMYPLAGDNEVAVFNREPSMVALLNRQFEQIWDRATPFGDAPETGREAQFSNEQRRIMRLLVGGMTTEAIASTLAVSLRTVNRQLEKMRSIFSAQSLAELTYKVRGEYPNGIPADW